VLWEAAVSSSVLADTEAFSRWRYRILEERQKRIQTYREVMVGKRSLWRVWRAELPQGNEVQKATIAALAALVHSFKAQPEHAERVARLSVEIYDGLSSCGIFRPSDAMPRLLLQSAALMHEIGRTRRKKGHHKISGRLISKMSTPVGWKTSHVYITALVARYHRGALPQIHHNLFCELSPENRQLTRELAAVLRLADSLDRTHSGMINKITVQKTTETLLVHAEGYSPDNQHAEKVAAARHLLETTTGLPCIIHRS
jgi:exopolyphosphatase/guanosine-5'-triphosphate,3'-diphosphate pyrophosphatase